MRQILAGGCPSQQLHGVLKITLTSFYFDDLVSVWQKYVDLAINATTKLLA